MFDELNLKKLMSQLNTDKYGVDEILLPSLQSTDALKLPGGFTSECLKKKIKTPHLTRLVLKIF